MITRTMMILILVIMVLRSVGKVQRCANGPISDCDM